jgi:hypothetical protein
MIDKEHIKGAVSEYRAAQYYLEQGYQVYWPAVQQGVVDFVVEKSGVLKRVQVKTATMNKCKHLRYLQCRTTRGRVNTKVYEQGMYDVLFIVYEDQKWIIPAQEIDTTNLSLQTSQKNKVCRWDKFKET